MNHRENRIFIYVLFAIFLLGCQGEEGPMGRSGANSLVDLTDVSAGNDCENGGVKITVGIDTNQNGFLDSDEVLSTSFVCNGSDGKVSLTSVSNEPSGANCKNGGVKIDSGIDKDGDGILNENEITATAYVCNGLDGNQSLAKITSEAAGNKCENGGLKVETGLDSNGDGILNSSEITATSYLCNGVDGNVSLVNIINEARGGNCENGGVKIESGVDTNGNNTLDQEEVEVTRYICNGIGGVINEEVQIKIVDGIGDAANTTRSTPVIVPGPTTFNINNFINVDSAVFVADPWVSNSSNFAIVELYNITDDVAIQNSLIRTNQLANNRAQIKTNNLFTELPKKEIRLGIRLRSETDGAFSASGIPYIFLYRSN